MQSTIVTALHRHSASRTPASPASAILIRFATNAIGPGIGRVGGGAGALGARGAKKLRPQLGRGALQNFGGADSETPLEC